MTKSQLVDAFAEAAELPKKEAAEHLERLCDIIAAELLGGGQITLPRVGALSIVTRAARKGRNPQTGKALQIPESKAVKFSVNKNLKDSLKQDSPED